MSRVKISVFLSLLVSSFFLINKPAVGQSKNELSIGTSPCPTDSSEYFNNCFGERTKKDDRDLTGYKYVGTFVSDQPHGEGVFYYNNGDFYEGDVVNGFAHGTGLLKFSYGDTYEGSFINGYFQGYGVYIFADGTKYEGDFLNDKFHGQGKFIWNNKVRKGDVYIGEFKNNLRTKNGKYIFGKTVRGQIRRLLYACCGWMG